MQLIWSRPASADLRSTDRWLTDNASAALASRTLGQIKRWAGLLRTSPFAGRPHGDFRVALVKRTPFLNLYRVIDGPVQILAVRHEREDWQSRA